MRKGKLFICALLFLVLLGGCRQPAAEDVPGLSFLTAFFTTNQDGRWDTLRSADLDPALEDTSADVYFSALEELCSEDCLISLAANRLPLCYDDLAAQYDCSFTPDDISISAPDENGRSTFSVTLHVVQNSQSLGTVSQNGELTFISDGDILLVDSIWIGDFDDLAKFLRP